MQASIHRLPHGGVIYIYIYTSINVYKYIPISRIAHRARKASIRGPSHGGGDDQWKAVISTRICAA
jgi:hypothetical protein